MASVSVSLGTFFFFVHWFSCAFVWQEVLKKCPRLIFQAGDADGDSPSSTDEVSPY